MNERTNERSGQRIQMTKGSRGMITLLHCTHTHTHSRHIYMCVNVHGIYRTVHFPSSSLLASCWAIPPFFCLILLLLLPLNRLILPNSLHCSRTHARTLHLPPAGALSVCPSVQMIGQAADCRRVRPLSVCLLSFSAAFVVVVLRVVSCLRALGSVCPAREEGRGRERDGVSAAGPA